MKANKNHTPLAERMRPLSFDDFVGQEHVVGKKTLLRDAIEKDQIPSMIFWGPPGSGKTTIAHVISQNTESYFYPMSAVTAGVKDIKEVMTRAEKNIEKKSILFIDEIHRFNKRQQDALLPYVENGTVVFVGATTENPSFEVNSALLSRSRVFVLNALEAKDIVMILKTSLEDSARGLGNEKITISEETILFLADMANGDARVALNALELAVSASHKNKKEEIVISSESIKEALQRTHLMYDKGGEEHYNIISALHKSMRGNDANASLYWLGRMLEGGEDPLYIARRLVRFASEDIGIANSLALPQAVAAYQACHFIGMPECNVILAQAVVYMAKSKKSNKLYSAYKKVQQDIYELPTLPVPLHIRNAPTKLMKNLGYGKDYKYTPNYEDEEAAHQDYLPDKLKGRNYLDE